MNECGHKPCWCISQGHAVLTDLGSPGSRLVLKLSGRPNYPLCSSKIRRKILFVLTTALCILMIGCDPRLSKPARELVVGTWAVHVKMDDSKVEDEQESKGGR